MSVLDSTLPTSISYVYATDEAIFLRCVGDFAELVPEHQVVAQGVDGSFPMSPWVMNSAIDFIAAGVQPGQVIFLEDAADALPANGTFMAVAAVAQHAITLRRPGMDAGQPPTDLGATDVRFRIGTFGPQIEIASEELDRQFRIDEQSPFWNPENIYNGTVPALRDACVLKVVLDAYTQETRSKDSDWSAKRDLAAQNLKEVLGRLSVKWGILGDTQAPTRTNVVRLIR